MSSVASELYQPAQSQVVGMNFLASHYNDPFTHNGDPSKSNVPVESRMVAMLNGESLETAPRLDAEGFARVAHKTDLAGVTDSREAANPYRDALIPFIKELSGADEIFMFPYCTVRRQEGAVTPDRKYPADFVHSDMTEMGAAGQEKYFYPPRRKPYARRIVHFNMWRLLSEGPTNMPLALCDRRSVRPADWVEGAAYFPNVDANIGTGYYHPNDHFRWVYFPNLTPEEVLVFKQYDSDIGALSAVPHAAFVDPSAPADVNPRISIEARCIARWYD